ncbi:MAG: hypothetical protein ABIK26_00265 [Candidatus Omnitrophota bacterium]
MFGLLRLWLFVYLLSCALPERVEASLRGGRDTQLSTNVLYAADAIYAGKALEVKEASWDTLSLGGGARIKGAWNLATFSVDHVIKGRATSSVAIKFFVPHEGLRGTFWEAVPKHDRCMVFLAVDEEQRGGYVLLDSAPVILLAKEPPPSVLAMQKTEIAGIRAELLAAAEFGEVSIALQSIRILPQLGFVDQKALGVLRRLSNHVEPEIKGAALAVRVRSGDTNAIPAAVKFAESTVCSEGQRTAIASALRELTSGAYVSELANVMKSEDAHLRRAASYALRYSQMKSVNLLPLFVRYLGDSDPEVQYNALMGIARIDGTVGELAPSYVEFHKAPQQYISKRQGWWDKNKGRFAPKQK